MKTVTITIPEEVLPQVAELIREHRMRAAEAVAFWDTALEKLNSAPTPVKQPKSVTPSEDKLAGLEMPDQVKLSKEDVRKLVVAKLHEINGTGIGATELRKSLRTSYSTTFRVLQELEKENLASRANGLWRAKH